MYRSLRVVAIVPVFNEESKIGHVLRRIPRDVVDEVVVVDDGSTDSSIEVARSLDAKVISLGKTIGVGAALREGYRHALASGFDVAIVMAGNNKDFPEEIPTLLDPIASGEADFVQGSRYLSVNPDFGDMPLYRRWATKLHPRLFSLVAGKRVTESTNGFRAIATKVLADPRLNLDQPWLDEYELEPYLYLKVIRLNYRTVEVPVRKVYPPKSQGQTKMKPIVGWWSMLRPLLYVALRLKD